MSLPAACSPMRGMCSSGKRNPLLGRPIVPGSGGIGWSRDRGPDATRHRHRGLGLHRSDRPGARRRRGHPTSILEDRRPGPSSMAPVSPAGVLVAAAEQGARDEAQTVPIDGIEQTKGMVLAFPGPTTRSPSRRSSPGRASCW